MIYGQAMTVFVHNSLLTISILENLFVVRVWPLSYYVVMQFRGIFFSFGCVHFKCVYIFCSHIMLKYN
jgi:hypothetical protein